MAAPLRLNPVRHRSRYGWILVNPDMESSAETRPLETLRAVGLARQVCVVALVLLSVCVRPLLVGAASADAATTDAPLLHKVNVPSEPALVAAFSVTVTVAVAFVQGATPVTVYV